MDSEYFDLFIKFYGEEEILWARMIPMFELQFTLKCIKTFNDKERKLFSRSRIEHIRIE